MFSGSMPLGLPEDFITTCAASLHRSGHHLCVDTSGTALQHLVRDPAHPPFLLRLDQSEAEQISGGALTGAEASADLAASLVRRGVAKTVVLGCGAAGSVLATAEARVLLLCGGRNGRQHHRRGRQFHGCADARPVTW